MTPFDAELQGESEDRGPRAWNFVIWVDVEGFWAQKGVRLPPPELRMPPFDAELQGGFEDGGPRAWIFVIWADFEGF